MSRSPAPRLIGGVLVGGLVLVVMALVVAMALSRTVQGTSMEPTLRPGDRILFQLPVDPTEVARFDIVAFDPPGPTAPSVKRVVGLPGDEVRMVHVPDRGVEVHVRPGAVGDWQRIVLGAWDSARPATMPCCDADGQDGHAGVGEVPVPDGMLWVLGDNLGHSDDSRTYGWVPIESVTGRLWLRLWPIGARGSVPPDGRLEPLREP